MPWRDLANNKRLEPDDWNWADQNDAAERGVVECREPQRE